MLLSSPQYQSCISVLVARLLFRENESSLMVELHFLVPVLSAVLIASQCLPRYKNKVSVFSSLFKDKKIIKLLTSIF